MSDLPFLPDWAVHPGEVLEQIMEDDNLTIDQVAHDMSVEPSQVQRLLEGGETRISDELAQKLEAATGFPARGWINLERQFQDDVIRLAPKRVGLFDNLDSFAEFSGTQADFFKAGVISALRKQEDQERSRVANALEESNDYAILAEICEARLHFEIRLEGPPGKHVLIGPKLRRTFGPHAGELLPEFSSPKITPADLVEQPSFALAAT